MFYQNLKNNKEMVIVIVMKMMVVVVVAVLVEVMVKNYKANFPLSTGRPKHVCF